MASGTFDLAEIGARMRPPVRLTGVHHSMKDARDAIIKQLDNRNRAANKTRSWPNPGDMKPKAMKQQLAYGLAAQLYAMSPATLTLTLVHTPGRATASTTTPSVTAPDTSLTGVGKSAAKAASVTATTIAPSTSSSTVRKPDAKATPSTAQTTTSRRHEFHWQGLLNHRTGYEVY
ncbi:hypothetical protein CC86DRAFT_126576 [Ophiobolus disseminans]|uniref:Uncharacterized protein n=1 Tax=Ophiobolus disseminans TaxID=1469910 RepID=A0A6A6ZFC3_9PLEO|nr:hypothetical protein CC86DRAFT_126576 [Ophiobolus disseminans]